MTLKKDLVAKAAKLIERKQTVPELLYRSYADITIISMSQKRGTICIVELHISGKIT